VISDRFRKNILRTIRKRSNETTAPARNADSPAGKSKRRKLLRPIPVLIVIFALSLPIVNPWVRGDGVGYYAYGRALLIEGSLDFQHDWQHANDTFRLDRVAPDGKVNPNEYTKTGHLRNLWTVGPSILWAPFLLTAHVGVLLCNSLGAHIPANGFSGPYLVAVTIATAFYGFLGLLISFQLARMFFDEIWAFLATIGIWWASSLPVYMYFNPSWSHAHSAFVNSLFVWYWYRTRGRRTAAQWILLGLLSGLIMDVYYPNGVFLLLPLMEAIVTYWRDYRLGDRWNEMLHLFGSHCLYVAMYIVGLLPTLITRRIIFGSMFKTGYPSMLTWNWASPVFGKVLFSSDHGFLTWTPILCLAVAGLFLFPRTDKLFRNGLIAVLAALWIIISAYPDWDGLSSFGNRFFVSLTPVFVLGLASFFDWLSKAWSFKNTLAFASSVTAVFILWNLAFVFQWGMHLISPRGYISWPQMIDNQFVVVPRTLSNDLRRYLWHRKGLMRDIEKEDIQSLQGR
jgi:hypothetical protein